VRGGGALLACACAAAACVNLAPPGQRDGAAGGVTGADGGRGDHDWDGSDREEHAPDADAGVEQPGHSTLHDGLVGYWKLDEAAGVAVAQDSSTLNNTGSIAGSPARITAGLPNLMFDDAGAFSFGRNDWVAVPDDVSLRPAAITIAVWVKLSSLTASATCGAASDQMQYIVHRRNTRGAAGMFEGVALLKDGTRFEFLLSAASNAAQVFARSTTQPQVGTWVHLVATYDGESRMQLFVNGVLEGTQPRSGPIDYDQTRPLYLARTGECGGPGEATWDAQLSGLLDDVRVYNRVLSDTEIALLAGGSD